MRFSSTFSMYVIKRLLINLLYIFLIFTFLSFIIDFLEIIRDSQGKNIKISQMLQLVIYKVPFITYSFLPFIFLFGSILTFTKLNNSFELAAAKSAGISIWSLCLPIITTILILSVFIICVFQPISSIFLENNRILGIKYLGYHTNRVSLQSNGIWLNDNDKMITIAHILKNKDILSDVRVYYAGEKKDYKTSYIAKIASLSNGYLILKDAKKYFPGKEAEHLEELSLETNLTHDQIQESIPHPDIIQFWDLKSFISKIKQSGFSSIKHELYYQTMLASPLLYISMVLIALACSINLPRNGKLGIVFIIGGSLGISIFFVNKMANVFALTAVLPITLAAIAPGISYLMLSFAALIHCEE
jgi:lipopolysaccharide export system permease protein